MTIRARSALVCALSIVIFLASLSLRAQSPPGTHLGATGGLLFPIAGNSPYDAASGTGYEVSVFVAHNSANSPLGARLELGYFQPSSGTAIAVTQATEKVGFVAGSLVIAAQSRAVRPYLFGGLGVYSISVRGDTVDKYSGIPRGPFDETATPLGWHVGAGISFPVGRSRIFVEARYRQLGTSSSLSTVPENQTVIPVLLGVSF